MILKCASPLDSFEGRIIRYKYSAALRLAKKCYSIIPIKKAVLQRKTAHRGTRMYYKLTNNISLWQIFQEEIPHIAAHYFSNIFS